MKNYEAPRIDVIEIEVADIIQTSGTGGMNHNDKYETGGGTATIVPIPPTSGQTSTTSLDNEY